MKRFFHSVLVVGVAIMICADPMLAQTSIVAEDQPLNAIPGLPGKAGAATSGIIDSGPEGLRPGFRGTLVVPNQEAAPTMEVVVTRLVQGGGYQWISSGEVTTIGVCDSPQGSWGINPNNCIDSLSGDWTVTQSEDGERFKEGEMYEVRAFANGWWFTGSAKHYLPSVDGLVTVSDIQMSKIWVRAYDLNIWRFWPNRVTVFFALESQFSLQDVGLKFNLSGPSWMRPAASLSDRFLSGRLEADQVYYVAFDMIIPFDTGFFDIGQICGELQVDYPWSSYLTYVRQEVCISGKFTGDLKGLEEALDKVSLIRPTRPD